jgi:hypothetical protein
VPDNARSNILADLLALCAAAGAGPLSGIQLVYVGGDGKILEVGKMAPSLAAVVIPKLVDKIY